MTTLAFKAPKCPWCGSATELVTDGEVHSTARWATKRSPQHPDGIAKERCIDRVPFIACTGCEYCAVVGKESTL